MKKLIEKLFEESIWFTVNFIVVSIIWFIIIFNNINEYLSLGFNWSDYLELDNKTVYSYIFSFIENQFIGIAKYIEIGFGVVGKVFFYILFWLFFLPLGCFFLIWPIVIIGVFLNYIKIIIFKS